LSNDMASEEDKKLTDTELELVKDDAAAAEASGKPLTSAELREKIKEIQKIKEEAAKKEELEKEIRRRADGKAMLEAAQKNAELKQKLELEQARKQREADAEYKKRLLEECKRDKEQRRLARTQNAAPTTAPTPQATVIPTVNSDDCRICFQFPDGKRVNAVFPSSVKFQVVFDHIAQNNLFDGNYELHRTYPRQAIKDYDKDLVELRLTPASVLAVTKHTTTKTVVVSKTKDLGSFLFSILYLPFATVIHFFTTLFGYNLNNPEESQEFGNNSNNRRQLGSERDLQTGRRNRRGEGEDSDDEATWNGNSTQQL